MKRVVIIFIGIFSAMVLLAACSSPEGADDGLTEDQRVETRAAEIIQATADFEAAVAREVAVRETESAVANPPTEPPPPILPQNIK